MVANALRSVENGNTSVNTEYQNNLMCCSAVPVDHGTVSGFRPKRVLSDKGCIRVQFNKFLRMTRLYVLLCATAITTVFRLNGERFSYNNTVSSIVDGGNTQIQGLTTQKL